VRVLVVNAGSSTLKLAVVDAADEVVADTQVPSGEGAGAALADFLDGVEVDAVGHRFVHGGRDLTEAVVVDGAIEERLRALIPLAPLHQPGALRGLDGVRRVLADLPQVACFDTAFHATLPPAAFTYAIPREWREDIGIRRYGFHGLSHAYATRRAAEMLGSAPARLVIAHLGAGASLTAVLDGRSVDTTMGFTPLEGLVMATRSGTIDPGIVTWLQENAGLSATGVEDALLHRSGLRGLAGTADMREVLAADSAEARLAVDVYVHRLRALIASMAAALGGLDTLVFTGGVGERGTAIRAAAAAGLGFLGVRLDAAKNAGTSGTDAEIGAPDAAVRTVVVHAREDLEIARQVRTALGG
jgi:acetate kinase